MDSSCRAAGGAIASMPERVAAGFATPRHEAAGPAPRGYTGTPGRPARPAGTAMSDPFRSAADSLLSLKTQFERLTDRTLRCNLSYHSELPSPAGGLFPVLSDAEQDAMVEAPGGLT